MALKVGDFFPQSNSDEWKFFERSSGETATFTFRAFSAGGRRQVELNPSAGHRIRSFFDRMAITESGLELRRMHFTNLIVDIHPPFVLTLGPETNQVDQLFPASLPGVPFSPPFNGRTTAKQVTAGPEAQSGALWEISFESRGLGGPILMRAKLRFEMGKGLVHYSGDYYGSFFIYDRLADQEG